MKNKELYYGFDSKKQKEHEKYLVSTGVVTQVFLDECNEKVKDLSDKEKNAFIQEIEQIMTALINALEDEQAPTATEVQTIMHRHYIFLERTWTPTKPKYLDLMQLYQAPAFKVFYDSHHPKLLEFMLASMKVFAEKEL